MDAAIKFASVKLVSQGGLLSASLVIPDAYQMTRELNGGTRHNLLPRAQRSRVNAASFHVGEREPLCAGVESNLPAVVHQRPRRREIRHEPGGPSLNSPVAITVARRQAGHRWFKEIYINYLF